MTGLKKILAEISAAWTPDPLLSITDWADQYFFLPAASSAEPGKYRTARTPYVREILDSLSPYNGIQSVTFAKPTQIGATVLAIAWMCYGIDCSPAPMLVTLPTGSLAESFSKQKLQPAIDETPRVRGRVKDRRSRDSGNTILEKQYPGGSITITGSNSPASFRSRSVKNVFLDDLDGFEMNVGGEGDPSELAARRTDSYGARKKIFLCSTPTMKGISRIEAAYEISDQRRYHVPCPHCGHFQILEWGGVDFEHGIRFLRNDAGQIIDVWYQCIQCHGRIDEADKTAMLEAGEWIPTFPERIARGYHLSALYSPIGWVSWKQIVEEFLKSKTDPEKLQVWTNTRMGLPWEERGDQPEWADLHSRAEPYQILTVPAPAQMLTAGVDVMDHFLSVSIWGWGPGEEAWLVYWGEIYGDPMQPGVWTELDALLFRAYAHEGGALSIVSMGVDSGGHCTQAVYDYARRRYPQAIACKGAAAFNKPILTQPNKVELNYAGMKIKDGVELWTVGTDTIKATLYSRLRIRDHGPGYIHFPIGLPEQFYQELTAEKRVTRYVKGFPRMEWVQIRRQNHALDAFILAYASAVRCNVQFLTSMEMKQTGITQQANRREQAAQQPQRRKTQWLQNQTGKWM